MESNIASAVCTHERASTGRVLIDRASIPNVDQHIENLFKSLTFKVSHQSDEREALRRDKSSTHRRTVGEVSSVRVQFSSTFLPTLKQLIKGLVRYLWIKGSLIKLINLPYKYPNPISLITSHRTKMSSFSVHSLSIERHH